MTGSLSIYHRLRLWWFRGGGRHLAVITSGAALFVALVLTLALWTHDSSVKGPPHSVPLESNLVDLTLVRNATEKGALCLDGSRPGYHLQRGFGSGADNWVLHIEGGGWCNSAGSCSFRGGTPLGSSHYMGLQASFAGILSQSTSENPDFYNWNRVKIRYCDGASFAGDTEIKGQNGRKLFFRGQRIWEAIMGELLSDGLEKAKQVVLQLLYIATVFMHSCLRRLMLNALQMLVFSSMKMIFLGKEPCNLSIMKLSGYRMWERTCQLIAQKIQNILVPDESDPQGHWHRCKKNIHHCDSNQIKVLQGYRTSMLNVLSEFQRKKDAGMFVNSCYIHCQTFKNITWHSPTSPRIKNKTIAEAVGDWYFGRREVKDIDCPFPCNPTCYNMDFS